MADLLRQFADDPTVLVLSVLVGLDVVLGVAAALKAKTFKFVIIADFLRADVLGKLVPYYAVWAAVNISGDISLGGYGIIEESVGVLAIAAVGASVLNSLRDLGLSRTALPDAIAGDDPTTPG